MPLPFVRSVVFREEIASTSDLARELIAAGGVELPLLVRAGRQTRGRGRGTNAWWSDPGSLTLTLVLDPSAHGLTTAHEPRLALAAAVAVVETIRPELPPAQVAGIRWPNDVEVGGLKVGGILPERVETDRGIRLLIGIGLNVRTRLDDGPTEVRRMAASLADWGEPPGLDAVLADWLARSEGVLPRLASDDPSLARRWAELDTLLGRPVRVNLGARVVSGVGRGIDPQGALHIDTGVETVPIFGGQVLRDY